MARLPTEIVVIGASAGGIDALSTIFSSLPQDISVPILVAIHLHPGRDSQLVDLFLTRHSRPIKEAEDRERAQPGTIYFAPPDYHLLVDPGGILSLSADEKVNFARPSIDVLFESAAYAYGPNALGIILTGANHDGSEGLKIIKDRGGLTGVQDPKTAEVSVMPLAAIQKTVIDCIDSLQGISEFIMKSLK